MPDDDPLDAPSEMSELDLSEDTAITGEDVDDALSVPEGSVIKPNPDEEAKSDPDPEAGDAT